MIRNAPESASLIKAGDFQPKPISCFKFIEAEVTHGPKMRRSARIQARQETPRPQTTTSRTRQTAPTGPPCTSIASGARQGPTQAGTGPSHPGPSPRTRQTVPPGGSSLHGFAFPSFSHIFLASTGTPHPGARSGTRQAAPLGPTAAGTSFRTRLGTSRGPPHPGKSSELLNLFYFLISFIHFDVLNTFLKPNCSFCTSSREASHTANASSTEAA